MEILEGVADVEPKRPSTSTSTASSAQPRSSSEGPTPIPPPKRGRPKGPTQKLREAAQPSLEKRPLPEDPKEFADAIAPTRALVRPILHGLSRLAQTIGTDALDKEEVDSGQVALGAWMYQKGMNLNADVLVMLWIVSVTLPRVTQFLEARKEKEKAKKQALYGLPTTPVGERIADKVVDSVVGPS